MLNHLAHKPRKDWDTASAKEPSSASHLHEALDPVGECHASGGCLLRGLTLYYVCFWAFVSFRSGHIPPCENFCWKSKTRKAWMQPFSPRHFFHASPRLFPICNNPTFRLTLSIYSSVCFFSIPKIFVYLKRLCINAHSVCKYWLKCTQSMILLKARPSTLGMSDPVDHVEPA